jgi:rubrerythrin
MPLREKLEDDRDDEAEGVKTYGSRKKETKGTKLSTMFSSMQSDEKKHHSKLTRALKGLKDLHLNNDDD